MRTLLRAIYYAVILGVGVDAYFFSWLYTQNRPDAVPFPARTVAAVAAGVATVIAWGAAAFVRRQWRKRSAARRSANDHATAAVTTSDAMVASSPLASAAARERASEYAARPVAPEPPTDAPPPAESADADGTLEFERPRAVPVPRQPRPQPAFVPPRTPTPHAAALSESVAAGQSNVTEAIARYGHDDPRTLRSKAVLACAYWAVGELELAIPLYEETVEAAVRVLGGDNLETLAWRGDLAAAYELDGRLDEAIEMYQVALSGRERTVGTNHPDTQLVRSNLAVATAVRSNLARGRGAAAP